MKNEKSESRVGFAAMRSVLASHHYSVACGDRCQIQIKELFSLKTAIFSALPGAGSFLFLTFDS